MVKELDIDDDLTAFLNERAEQAGDTPLTAEELARMAGEVEVAYRLAWLKRLMSSSAAGESDLPPPV